MKELQYVHNNYSNRFYLRFNTFRPKCCPSLIYYMEVVTSRLNTVVKIRTDPQLLRNLHAPK